MHPGSYASVMSTSEGDGQTFKASVRAHRDGNLRCIALALLALAVPCRAVPVAWAGNAGSSNWSAAANWNPGHTPADGDGVVFDRAAGAITVVDLSVRLDTLTFGIVAGPFQVHVAGSGGRTLSFSGQGVQNLTSGSGPIRQSLFADAGSSGGSLVFTGASGINLGTGTAFRPVDLSALGGRAMGQAGGRIVFQDQSSTGLATFNALRAEGASAAGAGAGEVVFRARAVATRFTTLTLAGGMAAGAAGGDGSFLDGARVEGIVNVLSGSPGGGAGGRAMFAGDAVAAVSSSLNNQGGAAGAGSEAVTEFRVGSRFSGTAINAAGAVAGASGGRIEFRDKAAFDSTGYDGSLGSLQIINQGGSVSGAAGGSAEFRDDSVARGSFVAIVNSANLEATATGTPGGRTRFADRSNAGHLKIYNESGRSAAGAGQASFENNATAGHAQIVQVGGQFASSSGGLVTFSDNASAGSALIENNGGQVAGGAGGGQALFQSNASAGSATIVNAAGAVAGASGGATRFAGNAGAGNAYISNQTSLSTGGGGRGSTLFADSSSAQNATIDNHAGLFLINAFTTFSQSATAGNARITNFGGQATGAGGGHTQFIDSASAGAANLVMGGGRTGSASGGQVTFFGNASAGSAALDLRGATVVGGEGGKAYFLNNASAGNSHLTIEGSQVSNPGGPEGAVVTFSGSASASGATFVIGGNALSFGSAGRVRFEEAATAANATFTTLAGYDIGGRVSFEGTATLTASAGNAHIANGSRPTSSGSNGDFGGATLFLAHSSADHAVIVNDAGRTAFGAQTAFRVDSTAALASITNAGGHPGATGGITFFQDTSSAGHAVIVNGAGAVNASGITIFQGSANAAQATITSSRAIANAQSGGWTIFADRSTAGQATLVAQGGSNGGAGGRVTFQNQATGGSARVVLQGGSDAGAGGQLDISGTDVWVAVGSIEGGGLVNLGARSLIVTGPVATTFSGLISGTAPPVFPSLTVQQGSLTLTGENSYSGRTSIGDGVNANSGKLVVANTSGSATGSGEVVIQNGGTLAGSGFIVGPVTLLSGAIIAPGDPVTLTLRDSLTWDGGGVVRLALGADSASSDHLRVGTLIRGADGPFVFDLVDFGVTAGAEYDLLSFDAMTGFVASDFHAIGFEGTFAFHQGMIAFTAAGAVTAVPEPSACALLLAGLVAIRYARKAQRTGPA